MNNKEKSPNTIILGAGLAGLAAAYELSRSGRKVTVIEKWDGVGGLARTIKVGKQNFFIFLHNLFKNGNQFLFLHHFENTFAL